MQIYSASSAQHNDSFLHIGYTSSGRPSYKDTAADIAAYTSLDVAIQATRGVLAAEGRPPTDTDASPALYAPGWQAPGEYADLFRRVINVDEALATDGPVTTLSMAGTVIRPSVTAHREVYRPDPWAAFQDAAAGYIVAILLCLFGLAMLAAGRRVATKFRTAATALIACSLVLCIAVPAAQSFATAGEGREVMRYQFVTRNPARTAQSARSYNLAMTGNQAAVAVAPIYRNPEQATMVLMHGIIGPWLRHANQPVFSLSPLQENAGTPSGNVFTPMNLGIDGCHLDGWGREFRYRLLSVDYARDSNTVDSWEYLLQSSGADGRFGTADDFTHRDRLQYAAYGDNDVKPHYSVFVFTPHQSDWESDHLVYLPGINNITAGSSTGHTRFARKHLVKYGYGEESEETTSGLILSDHGSTTTAGMTLQLYALSPSEVQ